MLTKLSSERRSPPESLVDLLAACHERIRRFTALAVEAAKRKDAPPEKIIEACADVERYFSQALPLHVADEDESIEPRLRGRSAKVDHALDTMTDQHARHSPMLELLLGALGEVRRDPQDETARDALAAAANVLQMELEEHLSLEERVIFPAITDYLSRDAKARIIEELRQRRRSEQRLGATSSTRAATLAAQDTRPTPKPGGRDDLAR